VSCCTDSVGPDKTSSPPLPTGHSSFYTFRINPLDLCLYPLNLVLNNPACLPRGVFQHARGLCHCLIDGPLVQCNLLVGAGPRLLRLPARPTTSIHARAALPPTNAAHRQPPSYISGAFSPAPCHCSTHRGRTGMGGQRAQAARRTRVASASRLLRACASLPPRMPCVPQPNNMLALFHYLRGVQMESAYSSTRPRYVDGSFVFR
jgi:hypothetical protein